MKHLFYLFALGIFFLSCSGGGPNSIEQPIMTSETFTFFKSGFKELDSKALVSSSFSESSGGSTWGRHADRSVSYFIALNCAPADGIALVEGFRVHVLDALKAAGATVVKDEVLEGEQLSGPLEFTDSRSVQGESSFDKSWHSGFTIAYSKSKIVGGISVGYKLDVGGRNVLQLSQVEEQGPVLDER